ncbi:hypothetical protein THASP1DRAFT_28671 [Thamnocephalis sphaerospora]|uniref:YABBY protein C-terminal domain-containing protein n=1 Tax=Thamnocephalis sphaerospora TaxID=78915 RepID=A0A4P9XVU9_9FUNG|nr:hypothetical protein THASP1DRAFT_28671 [Thamnocephalis sphaerospora]|eukprot:RKP09540.1 hypothetical protein THASP1DRAFT_28671 [Thamnocephalis sphaerospora]
MPKEQPAKKRATGGGGRKKISPYNTFMKQNLPKVKSENPDLTHKEAFAKVAELWRSSKNKAATAVKSA